MTLTLESDMTLTLESDMTLTLESDMTLTLESDITLTLESDITLTLERFEYYFFNWWKADSSGCNALDQSLESIVPDGMSLAVFFNCFNIKYSGILEISHLVG